MIRIYRKSSFALLLVMTMACAAIPSHAQDTEKPPTTSAVQSTPPQQPQRGFYLVKVQVVITRYKGAAKMSTSPYELAVTVGQPAASLRMGAQVPVPKDGSYQYMSVGTNIDCEARDYQDGRLRLDLTIEDSSVSEKTDKPSSMPVGVPTLQTLKTHNVVFLRDGQSIELGAADKVTGETVKINVTLKVDK